jgi:phosphatidylserine/phosphatidylglycerophosphate/cardiolipin synthase-like enzyme
MPFIDDSGMTNLISGWESAKKDVEKILITRHTASNPNSAITDNQTKLNSIGVKIYSYWLQKVGKYETFHAKVLLADSDFAYVGSANATKASLEKSMELGVMLKGKGAKTVSEIVDAALQIASA